MLRVCYPGTFLCVQIVQCPVLHSSMHAAALQRRQNMSFNNDAIIASLTEFWRSPARHALEWQDAHGPTHTTVKTVRHLHQEWA